MEGQLAWGILAVVAAGTLNGSFAAPMKHLHGWDWENSWLAFAGFGFFIFPWLMAFATVPHLLAVYSGTSAYTLAKVTLFGLMWGVGATLFGLGISRVGMAVGFALILGITGSFGSLLPFAVLHPEELFSSQGRDLIAGTLAMTIGLALLAIAGRRRERDLGTKHVARSGFVLGLVMCIFSGLFSSMLNFSFVFGHELVTHALAAGARSSTAANAIWSLTVSAGFIPNFLYCIYLLNINRTWTLYRKGNSVHWFLGGAMGLLWFGGIALYGTSASLLGSRGAIIGWPVFLAVDIIAAIFWGAVAGEWKGSSRATYAYAWAAVAVLLGAIVLVAAGHTA